GPTVIGPGASVAGGAMLKRSVLLAGAQLPAETLLAGAICGRRDSMVGA
nr:hypothetical protein [Solirubrobacterales bacterium]